MIHGLADLLLSGRLAEVSQGDGQELTSSLAQMMLEGVLARN